MAYRCEGPVYRVRYEATEAGVRRAALLRLWDVGKRLVFEPTASREPTLEVVVEGQGALRGGAAAKALLRVFPGLWWLRPLSLTPGLSAVAGSFALRILRQEPR